MRVDIFVSCIHIHTYIHTYRWILFEYLFSIVRGAAVRLVSTSAGGCCMSENLTVKNENNGTSYLRQPRRNVCVWGSGGVGAVVVACTCALLYFISSFFCSILYIARDIIRLYARRRRRRRVACQPIPFILHRTRAPHLSSTFKCSSWGDAARWRCGVWRRDECRVRGTAHTHSLQVYKYLPTCSSFFI